MSSSSSQLPVEALPAWAKLNGASLEGVALQHSDAKGLGLVAIRKLEGDQSQDSLAAIKVPRDLMLSAEAVQEYAKVDHNFQQLLEAVQAESTRKLVMTYLLCHLVQSTQSGDLSRGGIAPSPWTEYLGFLPRQLPVPSLWSELDRQLLTGTSLQAALSAKLDSLVSEFHDFRRQTEKLTFWYDFLWKTDAASLHDWLLVDAWYRSRCLELPTIGHAMAPVIDMANHATNPSAYYQVDNDGDIALLVPTGCSVSPGDELTISYGASKSAAEMLFSYGFIDEQSTANDMSLFIDPPADDPLARAKLHVFGSRPTLKLSSEADKITWTCPFAYLMCLNEEDGLEFRIAVKTDGTRQLRLLWLDEDVTDRADEFETLIHQHHLDFLFEFRVVAILHEHVTSQLTSMQSAWKDLEKLVESDMMHSDCVDAAKTLREVERRILEAAEQALGDEQKRFLADERVIAHLESAANESRQASENDDDDFS